MIERATEHDIATIPKVELHVHLNGSITEATASELAHRHGADPDKALELVDGRYPGRYPDFEGFLHSYLLANSFVRTPEDLEFVAAEFARGQAAQHVLYTEAIFTAGICVRNGMDPTEMWAALRRGLAVCEPETRVALVIDAIREPNKYRRTTIHVIGLNPGPEDGIFSKFLKEMAAQNFGEYRRVD